MMNTRLATAEWADSSAIAKRYVFESGKFWLGRLVEGEPVPLGYKDDRHICLVSGSRGGKGTSVIINNLCLYPGSVVVIDPKGENATITAARRGTGSEHCEGMRQAVHVLDPFKVAQVPESYRSCFNPLDTLDPSNSESIDEAGRIADALVVINPESKDPFWDESARALVKGLILHVLTADQFDGRRNLVTVRDLIMRGDWETFEHMQERGLTDVSAQSLLWEGVKLNKTFYGIISGIGESFASMATNSPKQFESVLQVANRNTEFIDSPGMRECLSKSDFKLSDLKTKRQGVSLYLSLPQRYMNTHYRWLRMMISLTVTEMEKVQGQPVTGHRVLMCLDEFAGLKHMEVIQNAVAQIAGYGVTLFFVLQSLEQLKATYKDTWETFLSNSGLKIFFNVEDYFSREYVSKYIGETEFVVETLSENEGENTGRTFNDGDGVSYDRLLLFFRKNKRYNTGGGSNSNTGTSKGRGTSRTPQRRALITPDELGKFFGRINNELDPAHPGTALVLISGENPFPVRRVNYYGDATFYKLFNPHPDYKRSAFQIAINPPVTQPANLELKANVGQSVNKGEPIYFFRHSNFMQPANELVLFSPVSGTVKKIGNNNELIVESDFPILDSGIEQYNKNAIGQFIREAREAGQKSMRIAGIAIASIFFFLFVFVFILPQGVFKCLFAFALLSACYVSLQIILSTRRKIRETEQLFN